MAETKTITKLHVVIDTENSYDNIGDIDGGMFDDDWLKEYLKNHGPNKLIMKLSSMQTQVINSYYEILRNEDEKNNISISK